MSRFTMFVVLILGVTSAKASDLVTRFFPGVELGMSTNEVLAQRPNATKGVPILHSTAVSLSEAIETNFHASVRVYYFTTNGLQALTRSDASLQGGQVVRDDAFNTEVNEVLSSNFTSMGTQVVGRFRTGVVTNTTVTIWSENGSSNVVVHLSDSSEATIVYFVGNCFNVTNFFIPVP